MVYVNLVWKEQKHDFPDYTAFREWCEHNYYYPTHDGYIFDLKSRDYIGSFNVR